MVATSAVIRLFQQSDRPDVRRLCCDTADMGRPVERFFADREVFADLWTRYYTDFEPEHLWVAERDGRVVGYLSTCWRAEDFRHAWRQILFPKIFLKALVRGVFFRPSTWSLLWANRRLAVPSDKEPSLADYPAHFHLNLDAAARGQGLGGRLLEAFHARARAESVPGITAATRIDNLPVAKLLERAGYRRLFEAPTFLVPGQAAPRKIVWGVRL